jgi:hypothetical protein
MAGLQDMRAHARGRSRSLRAGMAAANHHHIEFRAHARGIAEAAEGVKNIPILRNVSRETLPKWYQTTV